MLDVIRKSLEKHFDKKLVEELLAAYEDTKHNFYIGGARLNAVEGGRFCEAAFRLLEQISTGTFTGLNVSLDAEKLITHLANTPKGSLPDSIRLHIPRALRVIYDIRNNRDAAHLADGIDPNTQDSTLVTSLADWVLAEFVRLYHAVTANEAQKNIEALVTRRALAVQDFNGFLKVLRPSLKASEYSLLLLYEKGSSGATYAAIESWVHPAMRGNLRRTLHRLVHDNAFVHFDGTNYIITRTGMNEVEAKKLHHVK